MWCRLPTGINLRRVLQFAVLSSLIVAFTTTLVFGAVAKAATGANATLSFQGRLAYSTGGAVADGYYNIQFKIYQDGAGTAVGNPGGTLKWTESRINNGGTSGVYVKNGYLSVNLGSVNPFGTSVDWNQDTLWLSMNVAGTAAGCTTFDSAPCAADGEMVPMQRMTSVPNALNATNAQHLDGLTSSNFIQLGQGVQDDSSAGPSISLNKTSSGNFVQLQNAGVDVLAITNGGDIAFGASTNHTIGVGTAAAATAGKSLTVAGGIGGSGSGSVGGDLLLQGGGAGGSNANGGNVTIDGGLKTGTGTGGGINIGVSNASGVYIGSGNNAYIQIGNPTLGAGQQYINIGNANTAGGESYVTVGSGGSAAAGTTTIQAKNAVTINTNGVTRATFSDTSNSVYFGNGVTAHAPNNFAISGTNSDFAGVAGGALTIQGGNATVGNANGGNITLSGGSGSGTGTNGLVVLTTPTFSTVTNDANCYASGALVASSCTITTSSVDNSSGVIVGFSGSSQTATLPDPTNKTAGRVVYVTAANGSKDFTLSVNAGGTGNLTSMRQNTTATMIWNGNDWTVAGASNSTTLQSAYDNTLQSAGGAELIVSSGTNANGLTIRDSSTNPVNGTLLEVQNSSAATLFSVNSNIPEYATDAGAETAGGTASTFPSSTWSAYGSSTVSRYTTVGNYVATGLASTQVATTSSSQGVKNTLGTQLNPNMTYNVSFTTRLASGSFTDLGVSYSVDGSAQSVACISGQVVSTSLWTKVNCSFKAPSSGITISNAIIISGVASGARTYYIDNLSVTNAADSNYATDGSVRDNTNFGTNWTTTGAGSTVTRNIGDGNDASDSAQAAITSGINTGVRNKLSINPLASSLYRVSAYAKSTTVSAFTDFKIRYSRDGGTSFVDCVDYNTQIITSTGWTQITCNINTDSTTPGNPYVYFVQSATAARTFSVDTFSMTLTTNTTSNVQIGGGANGGPTTLLTLDKSASAPIAANNDALLGSMYYDTTVGKIQCYQASGWGSCGSSPDNIITISPEYNNAVMHGTGVGTMTSDFCSNTLGINDGSVAGGVTQPTICSTNETRNFYKWTSPQTSAQTYSIYVTYQLPSTFKTFNSGSTSLQAKTDSSNSSVNYQVFRGTTGSALTACSAAQTVSTGAQSWQPGIATGTADPSTCNFAAGDNIVFKITVSAASNANAYVGNLGFAFSNR